jgi:hypothetical protein
MEALIKIQAKLKAPKNQFNKFGNYNYRSCEDILEAVKPLLLEFECTLTIHDEIKEICGIPYVEATASIQKGDEGRTVTAQAGINPDRKGMDIAQSFGASSSYARKFALHGLFLIDDTKDPDYTNTHETQDNRPFLVKGDALNKAMEYLRTGKGSIAEIEKKYRLSKEIRQSLQIVIDNL